MRVFLVLMLVLCLMATVALAEQKDGGKPDSLFFGQVEIKDSHAMLPIYFSNDEQLGALTIPLKVSPTGVTFDSVSFAGSRVEYLMTRPVTIGKDSSTVIFGAICMMEDYIPEGKGLMAVLHMTAKDGIKSSDVRVDSTYIHPASLLFTKWNSDSYVPGVDHDVEFLAEDSNDGKAKSGQ